MSTRSLIRVIVCGSVDREDDGAAVWAAETLLEQRPALFRRVELVRTDQLEIEQLLTSEPGQPVVVVDAAYGGRPGTVVVRGLAELAAGASDVVPSSSHTLPVGHVLGLAAALGADLGQGTFVGLVGRDFGYGRQLSSVVRHALPKFEWELANVIASVMSDAIAVGAATDVS